MFALSIRTWHLLTPLLVPIAGLGSTVFLRLIGQQTLPMSTFESVGCCEEEDVILDPRSEGRFQSLRNTSAVLV